MKNDNNIFDEYHWGFIYLILKDDTYLNKEGRMIKKFARNRGYESISDMARDFAFYKHKMSEKCRELESIGHLKLIKTPRRRKIRVIFSDEVINGGLKIPYSAIENEL